MFWDVADKYKEALIACIIIAMGIQVRNGIYTQVDLTSADRLNE